MLLTSTDVMLQKVYVLPQQHICVAVYIFVFEQQGIHVNTMVQQNQPFLHLGGFQPNYNYHLFTGVSISPKDFK